MTYKPAIALGALALIATTRCAVAQEQPSPKAQLAAIVAEYEKAQTEFYAVYEKAKDDAERSQLVRDQLPKPDPFVLRIKTLVDKFPKDECAVDGLVWILQNSRADVESVVERLKEHLDSPKLTDACSSMLYNSSPATEPFLRLVLEKSPHRDVQGHACYVLAQVLVSQAGTARKLQAAPQPELLARLEKFQGKATVERLTKTDPAKLEQESEKLFERVVERFGDVKGGQRSLGDEAKGQLFELRNLAVGKPAPEIEGEDVDGVRFKLSDYRGKVVFLDFWGFW